MGRRRVMDPVADSQALQKEFEGASDRAAVVVAGAFLDELLREILAGHLISVNEKKDKALFEGTGPLATFSSKIEMAFRLGLISEGEHSTLHAVREIRNAFAHQLGEISFQEESVKARCKNIEVGFEQVPPKEIPLPVSEEQPPLPIIAKAPSDNPRAVFQEAVTVLFHSLAARFGDVEQITSPPDFQTAAEIHERMAQQLRNLVGQVEKLSEGRQLSDGQQAELRGHREHYAMLIRLQDFAAGQLRKAHALAGKAASSGPS